MSLLIRSAARCGRISVPRTARAALPRRRRIRRRRARRSSGRRAAGRGRRPPAVRRGRRSPRASPIFRWARSRLRRRRRTRSISARAKGASASTSFPASACSRPPTAARTGRSLRASWPHSSTRSLFCRRTRTSWWSGRMPADYARPVGRTGRGPRSSPPRHR